MQNYIYMVMYPVQADSPEEAALRAVDQMQDPAAFPPLVSVLDAYGTETNVDMSSVVDMITSFDAKAVAKAVVPPF